MKVLLAVHAIVERDDPKYFSLGLYLLKSAIEADAELADVEVEILDCSLHREDYADVIVSGDHDVIGLSCQCWNLDRHLDIARRVKEARPGATILLGGHSAAAAVPTILANHPSVDGIAEGEGERVIVEALKAIGRGDSLTGLPGLSTAGRLAPALPSIAVPPMPFHAPRQPLSSYYIMESMRGCVYKCDYCNWWVGDRKVRYFPDEYIEANLRHALDSGYDKVWLIDAAINFKDERLARLARLVRSVDPEKQLKFWYFLQWDHFKPSQMQHLEAFGTDTIHIGMESADPELLRSVGRHWNQEKFEACVRSVQSISTPVIDVVLGLPGDTPDGFMRTLDYAVSLDVNVLCFRLVVYPGNALYPRRESLGLRVQDGNIPFVLETPTFSADELDSVEEMVKEMAYFDAERRRYFLYEPRDYWDGGSPAVETFGMK